MMKDITSRYANTNQLLDDNATFKAEAGSILLMSRAPIQFRDARDNRLHVVQAGDTLETLAAHYFRGVPDAADLYWLIAEFQPTPITDPTLRLEPGSLLVIPSSRVLSLILNAAPNSAEEVD